MNVMEKEIEVIVPDKKERAPRGKNPFKRGYTKKKKTP
jgi:hypothetical protein